MNLKEKILEGFKKAIAHNSSVMSPPEVILWTDPDKQWKPVIERLQESYQALFVLGEYLPETMIGPAVWLKTVISGMLSHPVWDKSLTPVIYLPGISKNRLKEVSTIGLELQPLVEYQYTGTYFNQYNGKDWTVMALLMNPVDGLGLNIKQDTATKDSVVKSLPVFFEMDHSAFYAPVIDAEFINSLVLPNTIPYILKWMCSGDQFMNRLDANLKDTFFDICKSRYGFEPDYKNIKEIALKLGKKENSWKYVWQLYATAPHKYPEIENLLRLAKPTDLGTGIFALPEESWPQVNEQMEEELAQTLAKAVKQDASKALVFLQDLEKEHCVRRNWVWFELGKSPLADALFFLVPMASKTCEVLSSLSIDDIRNYYTTNGYLVDQLMRKALAAVKSNKDKEIVKSIIRLFYQPWLENITNKFQKLVAKDACIFNSQTASAESETFVLFVDAFRYELAEEFTRRLSKYKWEVSLQSDWAAIPSVTPTSKPNISPIAKEVSIQSEITEFRPKLKNGKDLLTSAFRDTLKDADFKLVTHANDIQGEGKYWQEIGDIDTKGHEEQAGMVKRVDEWFDQVQEALDVAFERGIKRIKIVTDHGWLLLPGGLPKTQLNVGLTETRWGRCALIKEGASTDLLHLPWRWNPSIFIAFAPGISFFRANEEYAHGGISIHECLVPTILIENTDLKNIEAEVKVVKWVNLKCIIQTSEVPDGYSVDIRTKYNDEKTSIVLSKNKAIKSYTVTLMVDDSAESKAATIVLMDENERILDKKPTTVGG